MKDALIERIRKAGIDVTVFQPVENASAQYVAAQQRLEGLVHKGPDKVHEYLVELFKAAGLKGYRAGGHVTFRLPEGGLLDLRSGRGGQKGDDAVSIILVSPNDRRSGQPGPVQAIEYTYSRRALDNAGRTAVAAIAESLHEALRTGVFTDRSGLAVRQSADAGRMFFQLLTDNAPGRVFHSNAEAALAALKQDKAAPLQWLGMLSKAGGIKEGEDRYTGLSDWLRAHPAKSIGRDEVQNYIMQHQIELYEKTYANQVESKGFRELQDEFQQLCAEVDDKYEEADRELGNFYREMKQQYGEDYLNCMDDMELEEENRLLELRDKYDTDMGGVIRQDVAFEEMCGKYGRGFEYAFAWDGDCLEINDSEEAARFIGDDQIEEIRLQYVTEGLSNYREVAIWSPQAEVWGSLDSVHFGDAGGGRCIAWVRYADIMQKIPLTEEEREQEAALMPGPDKWILKDGSNFVNGNDVYYPPGWQPYVPSASVAHLKEQDKFLYSGKKRVAGRENRKVFDTLEDAVAYYNRMHTREYRFERVLVIDEVQSHRHQTGRTKGYIPNGIEERYQGLLAAETAAMNRYYDAVRSMKVEQGVNEALPEEVELQWRAEYPHLCQLYEDWNRATREKREVEDYCLEELRAVRSGERAGNAPFRNNWHELCMKRMLHMAAEGGYDKVAWTTGRQQEERYDIRHQIDSLTVYTDPHPAMDERAAYKTLTFSVDEKHMNLKVNRQGRIINDVNIGMQKVEGRMLHDVIGKDLAETVMQLPPGEKTLDKEEMVVGGEGKKVFYDRILPAFMDKYVRKWGSATEDVVFPGLGTFNEGRHQDLVMHGVRVTPSMKEAVMHGQALFMRDRSGKVYGMAGGGRICLMPEGLNPETVVHEYTHLWAAAMMQRNPEGWRSVKNCLKDTSVWAEVLADPLYRDIRHNEDYVASEALARISGRDGARKLEEVAGKTAMLDAVHGCITSKDAVLNRLKAAVGRFWGWVGKNVFAVKSFRSAEEVADRVLYDLLRSTPLEADKAVDREDRQPSRFSDISVFVGHSGQAYIRCKVDGVQQMGVPVRAEDRDRLHDAGFLTEMAERYFGEVDTQERRSMHR